jgi:hypothetical protein
VVAREHARRRRAARQRAGREHARRGLGQGRSAGRRRGVLDQPRQQRTGRDRGARRPDRRAGAEQLLPDRADRYAQRGGDLLVRAALELAQQQRVALRAGERRDRRQQLVEPLAPREHLLGRFAGARGPAVRERLIAARAQDVEGRVVRQAVEPRPQLQRPVVRCAQRRVRVGQRLLDGVLGAVGAQQPGAVAHERGPVALDDRGQGRLVPGTGQLDEASVGLHP